MADPYTRLPFAEAIEFFRGKVNADTDRWDDIWREEHDTQFVVAGAKGAILQDFREAVDKAIAEGMSRADFLKEFDQIVATRGWDYKGGRDWRANLIYTTNLRTAYAAGRYQQQTEPSQLQRRPYWQWQHGDTRNPRPLHLALDGKIFPADSPFWQTMYPPCGWGCQCSVVTLSERDLKRLGKDEPDIPPIVGGIMSAFDPKTGTMLAARVEAGAGWDYAPGQSTVQKRRAQILNRLDPALQQQIMAEAQSRQMQTMTISQNRRQYEAAGPEYEKHYFDDQTGGYVLVHEGHNRQRNFESELFVSETFAQEGRIVELVNEKRGENVKSPDAEIDGQFWEFKQITPITRSVAERVQEGIGKARSKRVPSVAFHIDRGDYDVNSINRGIRQAFFYDPNGIIKEIALVFNNRRVSRLTREAWDNGDRF